MALAIFALAMVVGFGFYATVQADSASLERQKILFANGMRDRIAAVGREQESIAVWDDSVINAKAGNVDWMIDNISVWMYSYYGHDRVYVLDAADRPIHAMREGNVLAPARYSEDEPVLLPTVERVRRLIREPAKEDLAGGQVKLAAGDLVELDGKPAILSIMPLVPSSDRVIQTPGSEYLHISVDFITDALLAKIARQYLLAG
ncbi:CHASE4 domain-containing protein, partial [Mesorhizobium sp.]